MRFSTTNLLLATAVVALSVFYGFAQLRQSATHKKLSDQSQRLLDLEQRFGLIRETPSDGLISRYFQNAATSFGAALRVRTNDLSDTFVYVQAGVLNRETISNPSGAYSAGRRRTLFGIGASPDIERTGDVVIFIGPRFFQDEPRRMEGYVDVQGSNHESGHVYTRTAHTFRIDNVEVSQFLHLDNWDTSDRLLDQASVTKTPLDQPLIACWRVGKDAEGNIIGVLVWVEYEKDRQGVDPKYVFSVGLDENNHLVISDVAERE